MRLANGTARVRADGESMKSLERGEAISWIGFVAVGERRRGKDMPDTPRLCPPCGVEKVSRRGGACWRRKRKTRYVVVAKGGG